MTQLGVLLATAAYWLACRPNSRPDDGVQLLLSSVEIRPDSTFELRFPWPVISPDQIGRPIAAPPLRIEPELKTDFVWVSRRSGKLTPREPLSLGTHYRIYLEPGLKNANGVPLPKRLLREVSTPKFGITTCEVSYWDTNDIPILPEIHLVLNAAVTSQELLRHATFRRTGTKQFVPARLVEPADVPNSPAERITVSPIPLHRERTWREQFGMNRTEQRAAVQPAETKEDLDLATGSYRLAPALPLPHGDGWYFVIGSGLKSSESPKALAESYVKPLGSVRPFELRPIEADSSATIGRNLRFHFTKSIPASIAPDDWRRWIHIDPPVTNVTASTTRNELRLAGGFNLNTRYTIRVDPGLPSSQNQTLAQGVRQTVEFQPMEPHLWFPTFETAQLAAGHRAVPIQRINVNRFRVRAKRLDEHTLIHALRAYDRYLGRIHPGAPLDFNALAGRTIFEREWTFQTSVDELAELELSWDEILGGPKTGPVFLAAEPANLTNSMWYQSRWDAGPQALVQLTDLGLAWKSTSGGVHAWVFSHQTARGVPGVRLRLASAENEFLTEALTDAAGMAQLTRATNALWLLAQYQQDLHAVELGTHDVPLWSFRLPWNPTIWGESSNQSKPQIQVLSDRTWYRASEPIHLKGLVRTWRQDQWQFPDQSTASLRLVDPRGDVQVLTNVPISSTGSFQLSLTAPNRPRGSYQLQATVGEETVIHPLRVADFQAAPFEVTLDTAHSYSADSVIQIPVQARYLHGESLQGARMRWRAETHPTSFRPADWDGFEFGMEERLEEGSHEFVEFLGDDGAERLLTPTNGLVRLQVQAPKETPQPVQTQLHVEVIDLNDVLISKRAEFLIHPSAFYLGFRWKDGVESVLAPGAPLQLEVAAVAPDGTTHQHPVEVTASLKQILWETVRVQGAGCTMDYVSKSRVVPIEEFTFELAPAPVPAGDSLSSRPAVEPRRPTMMRDSGALATFRPVNTAGRYRIELRARDSAGNPILSTHTFYVSGDVNVAWNHKNGSQMELIPHRESYEVGDTAEVLIKAPFPGTVWVTVEREGVRRSFTRLLKSNADTVEVPILPGDAPNVYLSATLVRGSDTSKREHPMPEWRLGYCQLEVRQPENHLQLAVTANPAEVQPGGTVHVEVAVTRPASRRLTNSIPVARAEVTLYAVDEGVLQLSGDIVPDPWAFFNQPRPLQVGTGHSLNRLLPENPTLLDYHNKGAVIGGGGKEHGAFLREDFRPCAFWVADLQSGPDGRVSAQFQVPDSLSSFRVVALATEGPTRFGHGSTAFTVNKSVMLQPTVPPFTHLGDELRARALIFNRTTQAMQVAVSLQLDDKARGARSPTNIHNGLRQNVHVEPKSASSVFFDVALQGVGESKWQWSATPQDIPASGAVDRVISKTRVAEPLPMEREVLALRTDVTETNLLGLVDPRLLESESQWTIRVSNSLLGELGESVEQLLHYPYGCVEQTSSSLLPWLLFSDASDLLPGLEQNPAKVAAAIQEGITRLFAMQTSSGGLGYWPGDSNPLFWGSAYAAWVLSHARDHSINLPEVPWNRLLEYLSRQLRQRVHKDHSASCLALYALARSGRTEPAWFDVLSRERERQTLNLEQRALTVLAMFHSGNSPGTAAAEWLAPDRSSTNLSRWFGSEDRTEALLLMAWARTDPASSHLAAKVQSLLDRRHGGQWGTTQGNAWALYALSGLSSSGRSPEACSGSVEVASTRWNFALPDRPAAATHTLTIPRGAARVPVSLRNPQRRPLLVQIAVASRPVWNPQGTAAVNQGFGIERSYQRLDSQNITHPATGLKVGDRVLVTLKISADTDANWVAIEDPLPALLEVARLHPGETGRISSAHQKWTGDFEEIRNNRVRFFRNELPADDYEIRYIARVRGVGTVAAPPARIEAMYEPQRRGSSTATTLQVRE